MSLPETTAQVGKLAAAADALGSTLKFVFNEDGEEGVVYLDGTGEANTVNNEDKDADCTVKLAKADLDAMMSGDLNPMGAFMEGKLAIEGDMSVAMALGNLFS